MVNDQSSEIDGESQSNEPEFEEINGIPGAVSEVELLKTQLADAQDKHLRALAELENFKKRSMKERSEFLKYSGKEVFVDLLEVVDNFERARQFSDADAEQTRKGMELIHKLFLDVLQKWDVRGESSVGKLFNPEMHNAISRVPAEGKDPGIIVNELKKPYFYKDKLLRFGEVVVVSE
jgi:molecular chaperone GrpE